MTTRRLFSKTEKQIVLACFRAGLALRAISEKLNIPFFTVQDWHQRYLKGDQHWAAEDDRNLVLRQTALALFQKGYGYKRVATELKVPQSRVKYWLLIYRHGQEEFFNQGRHNPKKYPDDRKRAILDRYAVSTESKKQFCFKESISVGTLNRWLREKNE